MLVDYRSKAFRSGGGEDRSKPEGRAQRTVVIDH